MKPNRDNLLVGWGLLGTTLCAGFMGCSDIGGVNITNTTGGSGGSGTQAGGDGGTPGTGARNGQGKAGVGTGGAGGAVAGTGAHTSQGDAGSPSNAGTGVTNGTGGASGAGGETSITYGPPALDANCEHTGDLSCDGVAQKGKLICYQGKWAPNGSCATTERCVHTSGDCAPYVVACSGKALGTKVCSADDQVTCSGDATAASKTVNGCAPAGAAGAGGAG